jgi:hypothetical protein
MVIGHANHYCGIQSLSVWKSQGETVCLSCLPGFNVNDLQTDQLTCLANVMGIGIWTESGPAEILGFHITNKEGPEVNVSCESTTAGNLTASYETVESYLYWPHFFFANTVLSSSSLCGVTSAYDLQNGISATVTAPDPSARYWYVLVKVTSSSKRHLKTAPRGDATAGDSAPTFEVWSRLVSPLYLFWITSSLHSFLPSPRRFTQLVMRPVGPFLWRSCIARKLTKLPPGRPGRLAPMHDEIERCVFLMARFRILSCLPLFIGITQIGIL